MGIPATGKQISFGGINLFRLGNGKVVEDWIFRYCWYDETTRCVARPIPTAEVKNTNVDLKSITCSSHCGPYRPVSIFRDGP